MKYFIDTEFIEGFNKPLFGKRRHFIDLISIGIVAEDGREYYAISNEFNPNDADEWVKENVLRKIQAELYMKNYIAGEGIKNTRWDLSKDQNWMFKKFGKSNKQIASEITAWISSHKTVGEYNFAYPVDDYKKPIPCGYPEFYAYYADYDWVVFCSLFGRMIDLPKGFPMYCRDLKQMMDEKAVSKLSTTLFAGWNYDRGNREHPSLELGLKYLKEKEKYPKQENQHSALDDARWNQKLYEFIKSV